MFAYVEADNYKDAMEKIGKTKINKKWQRYMDKYFIKDGNLYLGPQVEMMEEVFHLD